MDRPVGAETEQVNQNAVELQACVVVANRHVVNLKQQIIDDDFPPMTPKNIWQSSFVRSKA